MKTVLTIAGSDCSGGAGVQADLKTIISHGVYGMSAITAVTAQNTMGVNAVMPISAEMVLKQLDAVFEDIYPDAVKIGMLPNKEVMESVAEALNKYKPENVVLDPVFSSTSGTELSADTARDYMIKKLFPLCRLITPNIPEAEIICNELYESPGKGEHIVIDSVKKAEDSCEDINKVTGCSVLLKGGHSSFNIEGEVADCLCVNKEGKNEILWIKGDRIENSNTHGTGCTLSSAIASNLALGDSLEEAVIGAKKYVTACIKAGLDLGHGRGPMKHVRVTDI